jgi:hypothetical protein
MRATTRLLIAVALSVMMTGCPKRVQLSLYNNTEEACRALLFGRSYDLPSHSFLRTDYPTATPELKLQFTNSVFLYHVPSRPQLFEKVRPFDNLVLLQLEKNRTIYLLAPTNRAPVSVFPPQPSGFPLNPVN